MPETKPNYTIAGYRTLIAGAETHGELSLIDEHLVEDYKNRHIKPLEYIELRSNYILRHTNITIEEQNRLE